MPAETPGREPGRVTISVEREEYAPGDTVNFSVTVATRGAIDARALVVHLFGVEEVEPFDDEEEDDLLFGLEEDEDDEEETGGDDNILTLSVNGEGVAEDEDEDEDDEDDWDEAEEDVLASYTFEDEAVLASDLAFKANETRSFNGSFTIPDDAQPTYFGIRATHTWWLDAYLESDVEVAGGKEILVR